MAGILKFCQGLPRLNFNTGDYLLAEGIKSKMVFILIEGQVEVVKDNFQINKVSQPGSIFGEMSVLLNIPHMANVKALTDTSVYVIEDGSDFLKSNSEITFYLAKILAQRLNGVTSYLMDIKNQFKGSDDHHSMVDEVLESLVYYNDAEDVELGSDRDKS
ncbi:MAG: cyclic nucleotide-binding domain-containing protein [Candidatus Dadabacteria bacterium]|nr:cyclic nucleotide-binding domain-containing protein [Candidatus Dadabacteria bacterium]NIS08228.1 cyclic nucleotide-binding domain-containing protein [Candidatus Dadabacteria bacterium]NIV41495.1 cyclic nucleotide-binding domain-containing protein [Candidatus Dadabacteria bacterium]NIY21716.1 cyclic nucleotide-binding domain-containing protein [Candidatus Dadabacteria bacterium]